jgi:hypothetical protein
MATTLTATIAVNVQANATKDGRATTGSVVTNKVFTNGTVANQADKAYYDQRTIASSGAPDGLDFAGGGLIDLNGDTITWVEMVGLVIKTPSTNTVDIVVGGHASPLNFGSAANTISVKPGEEKVLMSVSADPGYVVTAGSADTLKVAIASGTNQVYQIWAIGRSA